VLSVVGEAPAETELQTGEPLTGPSGELHDQAIARIGLNPKRHVAKINAIECRAGDENDYTAMRARLKALNRKLPIDAQWPEPLDCCKPRLRADLSRYRDHVLYGGTAVQAVTGKTVSLEALAGGPLVIGEGPQALRVVPTWHPATMLRARENIGVFFRHVEIAWRHFRGQLTWEDPWYDLHGSPEQFSRFLALPSPWLGWDCETTSVDPRRSTVWCFSLATPKIVARCHACDSRRPSCPVCQGRDPNVPHRVAAAIHLRSVIDGSKREGWALLPQLRAAFRDPRRWWVGHNSIYFDATVARSLPELGIAPMLHRHRDMAIISGLAFPERRRALGIFGSYYCDITAWKADNEGNKLAIVPPDDETGLIYCCKDSAVDADSVPAAMADADAMGANRPLREGLRPSCWPADVPWTLLEVDHWAHGMLCAGLHHVGVAVDQRAEGSDFVARLEAVTGAQEVEADDADGTTIRHAVRLAKIIRRERAVLQEIAARYNVFSPPKRKKDGKLPHNPGSNYQVAALLYDRWGWQVVQYTDTLQRSVADDVLLEHMRNDDPQTEDQVRYLAALRKFRQAIKALGTFVAPLRPEDWQRVPDPKSGRPRWKNLGGLVQPDGRIHGSWGRWAAPGRLASSENNQQNIPIEYRDQYVAEDGFVFVGADVDAFHLGIIANHWRIPSLRKSLREGYDLHCLRAKGITGGRFLRADGGAAWNALSDDQKLRQKPAEETDADGLRHVAKIFNYSGAYDAGAKTLWGLIVTIEDAQGNFPFAHYTLRQVKAMREAMLRDEPEWEELWASRTELFLQRGYVEEPVLGRRSNLIQLTGLPADKIRRFARSDIVNWEILGAEASIMRLFEIEISAEFPWDYAGPGTGTGIVNDTHDHVVLKVRAEDVERARACLLRVMNRLFDCLGWDIPITTKKVHVGQNLKAA